MFKLFSPGDLVTSTVGLGVIPSIDIQRLLDDVYGAVKNNEVRFICLKNGEAYTHKDVFVEPVHNAMLVRP